MKLRGEMQPNCVEPHVITYNAAISACEKAMQSGMAVEFRELVHPGCLETVVVTYNAKTAWSPA